MFYALRNLFSLIGLAVVVVAIYTAVTFAPMMKAFDSFDDKAIGVYGEIIEVLLETGTLRLRASARTFQGGSLSSPATYARW